MLETSPPSVAISLTVLDERKVCCSAVISATVSISVANPLVGQRHAELELEIGEDAQAAHDDLGLHLAGEVDGQAAVAHDLDPRGCP